MTIVRGEALGLLVAWSLAFQLAGCTSCEPSLDHYCSSGYPGGDVDYGYDADAPWPDEVETLPEADCDWPAVACGGTCCEENWRCNANSKTCFQCVMNANCSVFEGCEGDRCECTADRFCVLRPCDQACPDWQHCEWSDMGMGCVDNVCDPACDIGFRCEADECVPYCDKVCDEGTHCEWSDGFMICPDDPCDPPECTIDTHCEKGACVDNECSPGCAAYEHCDGNGACQPYPCEVDLDPPVLDFETVPYGESATLDLALRNIGSGPCSFVSAKITDCDALWDEGWSWSCSDGTILSSYFKIEQMPAPIEDGLLPGDAALFKVGFHAPPESIGPDDFRAVLSIGYKDRPSVPGLWVYHVIPPACPADGPCAPNVLGKAGTP